MTDVAPDPAATPPSSVKLVNVPNALSAARIALVPVLVWVLFAETNYDGSMLAAALFAGHPVAAPVIGTEQTITDMNRSQIAGYYRRRYSPDKMVVSVAGGVDHGDVVRWVRRAFGDRLATDATPRSPRVGRGRVAARGDVLVVERLLEAQRLAAGERMVGMDREPEPVLAIGQVLETLEIDRVPAHADRGQAVAQMADDVA